MLGHMQARTGPAGHREIPGGPMGRLAGGQQKYYDILFLLAIDIINIIIIKHMIVHQEL